MSTSQNKILRLKACAASDAQASLHFHRCLARKNKHPWTFIKSSYDYSVDYMFDTRYNNLISLFDWRSSCLITTLSPYLRSHPLCSASSRHRFPFSQPVVAVVHAMRHQCCNGRIQATHLDFPRVDKHQYQENRRLLKTFMLGQERCKKQFQAEAIIEEGLSFRNVTWKAVFGTWQIQRIISSLKLSFSKPIRQEPCHLFLTKFSLKIIYS